MRSLASPDIGFKINYSGTPGALSSCLLIVLLIGMSDFHYAHAGAIARYQLEIYTNT
jgi:hypothetical protein